MKALGHLRYCLCGLAISASLMAQGVPEQQSSGTPALKMCTDLSGANPEPCPSQAVDEEGIQKPVSSKRKVERSKKAAEAGPNAEPGSAALPDQKARCTDLSGNPLHCSAGALTDQHDAQAARVDVADSEKQTRAISQQPVSCDSLTGAPGACVAQISTLSRSLLHCPPTIPHRSPLVARNNRAAQI